MTERELPALPVPFAPVWPTLNPHGLGCGVEDRRLHDRYEAAEYGWQEGADEAAQAVPEEIFTADQMHDYARAALSSATPSEPNERDWKFDVIDSAMPYCLSCEKEGHRTSECWSTHGFNRPREIEIARLAWIANGQYAAPQAKATHPTVEQRQRVRANAIAAPKDEVAK